MGWTSQPVERAGIERQHAKRAATQHEEDEIEHRYSPVDARE
jgi:hypothetical protein